MPGRITRPRVLKASKAHQISTHGVISTLNTQHPACRFQIRITRKSLDPSQPGPKSSNAMPLPSVKYFTDGEQLILLGTCPYNNSGGIRAMGKDDDRVWPELRKSVQGIKCCLDMLAEEARDHGLTRAADLICVASEAIVDEELEQDPEPPPPTPSLH